MDPHRTRARSRDRGSPDPGRAHHRRPAEQIRRIEARYPAPGGEPPAPPLREIEVVRIGGGWRYAAVAVLTACASVAATWLVLH